MQRVGLTGLDPVARGVAWPGTAAARTAMRRSTKRYANRKGTVD
jgi:hypothetical protein